MTHVHVEVAKSIKNAAELINSRRCCDKPRQKNDKIDLPRSEGV